MKKILLVAGARPNFMKIAPVLRAMEPYADTIQPILVHTGQHYDSKMSDAFFTSLGIKKPEYNLEVGSGSHAIQTAGIMVKFEDVCIKEKPDMVVVVGDVNSTIAAGLVAKKQNICLAHIEAGLRSRDLRMPEEINRMATDAITDLFFTTEKEGTQNLLAEGHAQKKVHFVGHVMIDNLFYQINQLPRITVSPLVKNMQARLTGKYGCMTLHRPSNVDDKATLSRLLEAISVLSREIPVIFPCHPRTLKNIRDFRLGEYVKEIDDSRNKMTHGIAITEPLDYNDFLSLWKNAAIVLTDSGGLQEETTALRIPCITVRETTERPITTEIGSNEVVGTDKEKIINLGRKALKGEWKKSKIPPLWDGKASERIVETIIKSLC
jgi:UDP-N-acetylglucosamine 2-epimerase (non-hydrolysing)